MSSEPLGLGIGFGPFFEHKERRLERPAVKGAHYEYSPEKIQRLAGPALRLPALLFEEPGGFEVALKAADDERPSIAGASSETPAQEERVADRVQGLADRCAGQGQGHLAVQLLGKTRLDAEDSGQVVEHLVDSRPFKVDIDLILEVGPWCARLLLFAALREPRYL